MRKRIRRILDLFQGPRKLRVSKAGQWYIILTTALGVVSISSGNNVIYLIESLLLAGLILSGILSERMISSVDVDWHLGQGVAGEAFPDWIRVKNKGRWTLFCIEIGEWRDNEFVSIAFIPKLNPLESLQVASHQIAPHRGEYAIEAYAVATSYPFGFAQKLKIIDRPLRRVIWPSRDSPMKARYSPESGATGARRSRELETVEGEVRPYTYSDDARRTVAALSVKGLGPMVRVQRHQSQGEDVVLNLRGLSDPEFEERIKQSARIFYLNQSQRLILVGRVRKKIEGQRQSLHALALARREEGGEAA